MGEREREKVRADVRLCVWRKSKKQLHIYTEEKLQGFIDVFRVYFKRNRIASSVFQEKLKAFARIKV